MIEGNWLFIGTDHRLLKCSQIMKTWGYNTAHYSSNSHSDTLSALLDELSPAHIVLPILEMKNMIPTEEIPVGTTIYPGVMSANSIASYEDSGFPIRSYMKEVEYVWENARLTAEGFLLEYYESTKQCIFGKQFYVTGFGKVAKMTAEVLAALGASVTVIARSSEQLGEATALGYSTIPFASGDFKVQGTLINTIPARWLTLDEQKDLRVFDLASAPGCLKDNAPDEYYTIHLGLPGKHFPEDAANALAKALLRMNSR